MLMDRLYKPNEDQILYHYCSGDSLISILETRTMRFTDVNLLNDWMEGRWGYRIFEAAATRILNRHGVKDEFPVIDRKFFDRMDEVIAQRPKGIHAFVSCFSKEKDSLSQWRAYADDGRGFAIGFSAKALKNMPASLLEIEYDQEKQIKEMILALGATYLRDFECKGENKDFVTDCGLIGAWSLAFKNPAFISEQEVRLLHAAKIVVDEMGGRVEPGEVPDTCKIEVPPIRYRSRNGCVSGYIDMPWSEPSLSMPIAEVVMGPKCPNAPANLFFFLGSLGLKDVNVRSSLATYV